MQLLLLILSLLCLASTFLCQGADYNLLINVMKYKCGTQEIILKGNTGQCKCADNQTICKFSSDDSQDENCPCPQQQGYKYHQECLRDAKSMGCKNTDITCKEDLGECVCKSDENKIAKWDKNQIFQNCEGFENPVFRNGDLKTVGRKAEL